VESKLSHVGHWMAYCTCPGWLWWWRILWNEDWQGKPKYSEKTCPRATLSTTNPTWPDPGLNPARRGGKPATNRLSYGAAYVQRFRGMYFASTAEFTIEYTKYKFIDMSLLYRNLRRGWKPIFYEINSKLPRTVVEDIFWEKCFEDYSKKYEWQVGFYIKTKWCLSRAAINERYWISFLGQIIVHPETHVAGINSEQNTPMNKFYAEKYFVQYIKWAPGNNLKPSVSYMYYLGFKTEGREFESQ
jgi:hypothetical protein